MLEIEAPNVEDDPLEEAMAKYPTLPDIPENQTQSDFLLNNLPSVPTHAPLKTSKDRRSSPLPPAPPPMHIKMPEPMPMPVPAPIEKDVLQLPSPTGFIFPPASPVVEASQLAAWISKRNETRPSILILDIRPRDVYERGCIKHSWIAQIEPLVLKQE